jgi:hypothetical protein
LGSALTLLYQGTPVAFEKVISIALFGLQEPKDPLDFFGIQRRRKTGNAVEDFIPHRRDI